MDEKRREAIEDAAVALKYQCPEITAAFDRWQKAIEAAGLDSDEVNGDSPEYPPEVRAAYRDLEAVEAALEARVARIFDTPLVAATRPASCDGKEQRWAIVAKKTAELVSRLEADVTEHSSHLDPEPAEYFTDQLTVGDLRLMSLVLGLWLVHYEDERDHGPLCSNPKHADA